MADFSTWDRSTLEQFAQEATDKLIENRAAIAELVGALAKVCDRDWTFAGREEMKLMNEGRAAITKHTTTTKEGT